MGQFGGNADAKKSSSKRGYYTTSDESGIPEEAGFCNSNCFRQMGF